MGGVWAQTRERGRKSPQIPRNRERDIKMRTEKCRIWGERSNFWLGPGEAGRREAPIVSQALPQTRLGPPPRAPALLCSMAPLKAVVRTRIGCTGRAPAEALQLLC